MSTVVTLTVQVCLADQHAPLPESALEQLKEDVHAAVSAQPTRVGRVAYAEVDLEGQWVNPPAP